jgi:hypothetical protein
MDEVVTMKLECTPILDLHEVIFEHTRVAEDFLPNHRKRFQIYNNGGV